MTDRERQKAADVQPPAGVPPATPPIDLLAETDAMRLEATALGLPDTVEGLLTFALREIAALRLAGRVLRADIEGCRTETVGLHSEVARLKLRVKGLEGEL